jgi:hypothetical protein
MSDKINEMDLDDIETRLDELRDEKAAAGTFHELVGETTDNLGEIQASEFVDDETAAKIDLLATMLDWTIHHDVRAGERIRYERERLRLRKIELERERELEDGDGSQ